jgi:regulator of protease activity HflC (stomatin/prohibitin superfamily)
MVDSFTIIASIIVAALAVFLLASSVRIIRPYEIGLYIFLGKFKRRLDPGLNLVVPFGSLIVRIDQRTQTVDVEKQEVITKDNSPVSVDAIVYLRVLDAEKAYFKVQDYMLATTSLAQTTLRSLIGDMDLDQVFSGRETVNYKLRDILDKATDPWGVKIEQVELREVDPAPRVKAAMEAQTSSEREKRAQILAATGTRDSQILVAEGQRQARILEALADKESQVLRAQGQARALQILGAGSLALDDRGLSILGLHAIEQMAKSPATKFVIPMELTRSLQAVAKNFGLDDAAGLKRFSYNELRQVVPDLDTLMKEGISLGGTLQPKPDVRPERKPSPE